MSTQLITPGVLSDLAALAGLLHFSQIPGTLVAYRMLHGDEELGRLSSINRRIVLVTGLGLMLAVLGLGVLVMVFPAQIAGASALGTGVAGFLAVFWGFRAAVQMFLYPRSWPRHARARIVHYALVVLFAFLTLIYALAVVLGPAHGRVS
jgi:hypothetical protein